MQRNSGHRDLCSRQVNTLICRGNRVRMDSLLSWWFGAFVCHIWNSKGTLSQKTEEINISLRQAHGRRGGPRAKRGWHGRFKPYHACDRQLLPIAERQPSQSPVPGFGEKNCSNLPSTPSISLASGIASRLTVTLGQIEAYSVLIFSHFS